MISQNRMRWNTYINLFRYLEGGREPPYVDCYGAVRHIYARELNVLLPEHLHETLDSVTGDGTDLRQHPLSALFMPIKTGLEQEFDLAVMRQPMRVQGRLQAGWWHMGVVSKPGFIFHVDEGTGASEDPFRDTAESRAGLRIRERNVCLFRLKPGNIPAVSTSSMPGIPDAA